LLILSPRADPDSGLNELTGDDAPELTRRPDNEHARLVHEPPHHAVCRDAYQFLERRRRLRSSERAERFPSSTGM